MHELSLVEGVVEVIEAAAREQGFSRVATVWLEVGQLAGVEVDAMRFCFDAVTRHTVAEGASLEIVTTPGSGWCNTCACSVPMSELHDACPHCGGYALQVERGMEMRVKELDVS